MRLSDCVLIMFALALCDCRSTAVGPAKAPVAIEPGPKPRQATGRAHNGGSTVLGMVARGKELTLRVVQHAQDERGLRVIVTGRSFSAHADGEGALAADAVPQPPLAAPFDPATETVIYAGVQPHLFAFRRKAVPCLTRDDAAVLVWQQKRWRELPLRDRVFPPHAFLAWEGGALVVDSQIQACGWATSSPVEQLSQPSGTVFTHVSREGVVSHPTLGLDPTFMAWGGSSAEQTLTLVGTYGVRRDAAAPAYGSHNIVVMRRHGQAPFAAYVIVKTDGNRAQSVRTRVREFGSAALLWPPPARDDGTPVSGALAEGGDEIAWKGQAASVFKISDAGMAKYMFRSSAEQDCHVVDAGLVGPDVYAVVACPGEPARLVRAQANSAPERVQLPSSPQLFACEPVQITVSGFDDLWIRAVCGAGAKASDGAIFRRGHAQEPLLVP